MLGRKQLGAEPDTGAEEERKREAGYGGELFLMMAGALFLAFNVAPTEEMILIAFQMTPWHALALGAASVALLHRTDAVALAQIAMMTVVLAIPAALGAAIARLVI
jgi:uncharacterized membrane protein